MTLATHAVIGGCIGALAFHNVPIAMSTAFVSHFIFDTIPHWDYSLSSLDKKKTGLETSMNTKSVNFLIDITKIAFDFCIGMGLVYAVFYTLPLHAFIITIVCALCAVTPDPLQFVYWKLKPRWMKPLQQFHMWMHAITKLDAQPLLGIFSQTAIIAVLLLLSRFLH